MEYKVKDIVFVKDYIYKNGVKGSKHNFVIIEKDKAVDLDYYGFLMSSNLDKYNLTKYPYNVLVEKNNINNLRKSSIVKCDDLIFLKQDDIKFKIGEVSDKDLEEFKNRYIKYLDLKNTLDINNENNIQNDDLEL